MNFNRRIHLLSMVVMAINGKPLPVKEGSLIRLTWKSAQPVGHVMTFASLMP